MTTPSNSHLKASQGSVRAVSLGALAAGFGLVGLAAAQTATPAPSTPQADDPATVMPVIRAKATAVRQGKDSLQSVTSSIGKGTQELRDIPQSVTVVTERLIDDRNLDTMKEALHNTAGISFQAAEGGEEDIRLRGFSLASSGDIFVDGLRDPAFYERDTFNYDRLEVLRGSASMLFGRGSTGGAVNQVNKQPLLFGRNEVAVTLGSGQYLRATADLSLRTGENAALRLNAMSTQAKGFGAGTDKAGVAASLGWGIGMTDEFTASLYHLKNANDGVNYGIPWLAPTTTATTRVLVPVDTKNYYGAASDYSAGSADTATIAHTHRFAGVGEWKTVLRAGRYERDLRASAIRFAAAALQPGGLAVTEQTLSPATVLTRGTNNKIQDLDSVILQSDYSGRFQALGLKHTVMTGLDLAHDDFTNYAANLATGVTLTKPNTKLGSPGDGGAVNESLRVLSVNRTFTAKSLGLYVQDLVQLAPQWKLVGGLRWDRFDGDYQAPTLTAANGTVTPATQRTRSDGPWSKRLGALYQPSAFASWHLSYGTSFNTSGDTYQYDALGSNTPPEGSVNFELGGKFDLVNGNLSLRFALFHSVKTNERNRDETSVNATNYVLSGQRHAAGVEFDVAGRFSPAWEVFASYAFIPDARIDKASSVNGTTLLGEAVGSRPGLTPKHSGTVWSTYRLDDAWRFGAGINVRSKDAPQLVSTFEAPGFVTADLMAEYTRGDFAVKANLTNLANTLYADSLYRGHYVPGKPRTLQLTLTQKF